MGTFSGLLALCAGNQSVTGGFSPQRPVTRSFDVFSDVRLKKRLSKQSRRRCFETISRSLSCHCNDNVFQKSQIWPVFYLYNTLPRYKHYTLKLAKNFGYCKCAIQYVPNIIQINDIIEFLIIMRICKSPFIEQNRGQFHEWFFHRNSNSIEYFILLSSWL